MAHPTLRARPSDLIGGEFRSIDGAGVVSVNPADPSSVLFSFDPVLDHVDGAVAAARAALPRWAAWPAEKRHAVLRRFAQICAERKQQMADLICDETGKAMWDSAAEAGILPGKVDITLDASPNSGMSRVTDFELPLSPTRTGRCTFKPHGVMAVIGPYNFPAHLPNGHIVPALAMGNTVVFKPSEKTPAVGQALVEMLQQALDEAGAPAGVINLVQGGAETAVRLTTHTEIDGILFTGSWPVGRKILENNLDRPGRIIALEMGGNNPAVVMPDANLRQAAIEVVRAAFVTTGQRCTCTRRLIVHEAVADRFVAAICKAASTLIVGHPRAAHPVFMGPLISEQAREGVLAFQERLIDDGAEPLLAATTGLVDHESGDGYYITPGVLRVDRFIADDSSDPGCDIEAFGPLLRIATVGSLDEAIEQANATRYGLAASIFTPDAEAQQRFIGASRAGCINVNTGTAGASSKLPFGGLGWSGNHRPAGSFSLDYTAMPVASMVETSADASLPEGMSFDDGWLESHA
ncbi:MAG: aldehyde dehydrogenase family protein [Phycisphaerales bacterium]